MSFAAHPTDLDLKAVWPERLKLPEVKPPFAQPATPQPNPVAELGKGKPAARLTDQFAHSSALATMFKFIAVAVAAIVVAAVATALIVGTGGLAAGPMLMMVGGGLAAVGGAGLAGKSAGSKKMGPPTGAILLTPVNTNVFSNSLLNACATSSEGACAKDPGPPIPVAMGSDSVFIHSLGAARVGDKMACGAAIIAKCSPDVLIGGNPQPYMEIQSEVPEWMVSTLKVMAIGGLILTGAGAVTVIAGAFIGGGLVAGGIATGEMALMIGGGMAMKEGGKYVGGQVALAQGHSKDSYEYEAYRFYGETLSGVAFDVGSAKGMDTETYKGAVENIKAKAADPNTKLGQIEAAANAKGRALKKGMTGAAAGAVMHANVMMTNLGPPIPKAPTHFEAPAPTVKTQVDITPKSTASTDASSGGADIKRTTYEADAGVFNGKGVKSTSGVIPPKPTVTVHIKPEHPSNLVRKNDFDSVKTPKKSDGGDGAKPKEDGEAKKKKDAEQNANKQDSIILARKQTARDFYRKQGWPEGRIDDHMAGIDFTKPIEVVTLKKDIILSQWQSPGAPKGNYFAPKGETPTKLGISPVGHNRATGNAESKIEKFYKLDENTEALSSKAASIEDDWSSSYATAITEGGGQQYFVPDVDKFIPYP